MLTKLRNQKEGFTIIEVMIVLAIAGLIMLIVLIAIPALQRNSRNTQRKNDVGALVSSVNEFVSNNGGTAPTTAQVTGPSGAAMANARLGFYAGTAVYGNNTGTPPTSVATTGASATVITNDNVIIWVGYRCDNNALSAAARSVAVQYAVEGDTTPKCSQA